MNYISAGPRLHITTHLQAASEADRIKGRGTHKRTSPRWETEMDKHIQVFCSMQLQHNIYTSKPVASKQSSYTLIRSLGLLGDDLASPMAASQLAFLHKCHFRSYQKPRTTLPAHLCNRKVPQAYIFPPLQRFTRVPYSSVTIMSTSSELIN